MTSVGVYRELFCKLNSSPHELGAAEQPPVSAATPSSAGVLIEANVNSLLLAALKQLRTKLPISWYTEGYEDLGTTQKQDTKDTSQNVNYLNTVKM